MMTRERVHDRGFDRPALMPRSPGSVIDRFHELRSKLGGGIGRMKAERGKELAQVAMRTAGVAAGAAAFGAIQGRYGAVKVLGIPVDLGTAIVGHAAWFFGLADGFEAPVQAFSDGALASYVHTWAKGWGKEARAKAGLPAIMSGPIGDGALPDATGGRALTDEELASLASRG